MPDLTKKTTIRKGVMIPCFAFMAFIIVLGIFKNDWLKTICKSAFRFSLINFGWAYQLVAMASLVCVAVVTFSKIGNLRIGGPNAPTEVFVQNLVCYGTDRRHFGWYRPLGRQ